jgi:hypothetical protein
MGVFKVRRFSDIIPENQLNDKALIAHRKAALPFSGQQSRCEKSSTGNCLGLYSVVS